MQILCFRSHTFTINFTSFRTENSRLFVSEVYCSLSRLNSQFLFMQCNVGTVFSRFSHELCTFPPRRFATEELLLAADTKSELSKSFPSLEDPASSNRDDMKYVIDGGMLIHRITWKVGSSFTDICASYVSFLSKYLQCTVVSSKRQSFSG